MDGWRKLGFWGLGDLCVLGGSTGRWGGPRVLLEKRSKVDWTAGKGTGVYGVVPRLHCRD